MENKIKISVRTAPKVRVTVKKKHTTIPNDYNKIKNIPSINGVSVKGELSSEQLELLSAVLLKYKGADIEDTGIKIVVFDKDGNNAVLPISAITDLVNSLDNGKTETVDANGEIYKELNPDVFYIFSGEITSLTLAFATAKEGRENEYKGQFSVGGVIPAVEFPDSVRWVGEEFPELEENRTYQFSVVNDIGVIIGV